MTVTELLKQGQYDRAIPLMELALREAAAESPERLTDVARGIVAWQGFFANSRETAASEPYFRAVLAVLEGLAGPESPAAMAAAENLAGLLGSLVFRSHVKRVPSPSAWGGVRNSTTDLLLYVRASFG